jgi:hypothetical protein
MKKFLKIFSLVLVIGLFTIQSAWAKNTTLLCIPHQVKTGETVLGIAEQYSANPERLIIRMPKAGYPTIYLNQGDKLFIGETVYLVEEKIDSNKSTSIEKRIGNMTEKLIKQIDEW